MMAHYKKVRIISGLVWLALMILAIGGALAYLLYTDTADPNAEQVIVLLLAITITAAGICLICATADWWIKH